MVKNETLVVKPPHWAWDFLKPVNLVFLALAVAGLVFGWYWYYEASSHPAIAWSAANQIIFDHRNATTGVTVMDAHGTEITDNMYALQITVWNAGNARFDNVDEFTMIREPLTFRLSGDGRIVSASITNTMDDTAGGWAIQADQKSATMKWRHFDPGAAARILILYTGDDASDIKPQIAVAGYSVLRNVPSNVAAPITLNPNVEALFELVLIWAIAFALLQNLGIYVAKSAKGRASDSTPINAGRVALFAAIGGILMLATLLVILYYLEPPSLPRF